MENRSEYFKAKRRVVLPLSKRKNLKGMPTEVLKKFLKSQDVYWHGSVLDKSGDLFQPKTVGEIKKASMFDLTFIKHGKRTMFEVDFDLKCFVISSYDKGFMLFLSDKWQKFLEDYMNNEINTLEL